MLRIRLERSGLVQTVHSLSPAKQALSMHQSSRRLFDTRLDDRCIVCCLADRLPPNHMPLMEPVLSHSAGKGVCVLGTALWKGLKIALGRLSSDAKGGKARNTLVIWLQHGKGNCDNYPGYIYMSTYFTLLIFPSLPTPLSNDRCWSVALLQLQPFRPVALGATRTAMHRGSILQNWVPSSWLSHISQAGGWGERGERKGAPGSWDGGLRWKEG